MILIKRICGFFCAKPTSTDAPEISAQTTSCSHPPAACSLSANALQQGGSARSQPLRELSQTPDSISCPSPTAHSAALRKKKNKKWRLSNRNVLLDGDGREVFVKEFVLQRPASPLEKSSSLQTELPIYEAQVRYSTSPSQQHDGHQTAEGAERQDPATHVNPGHDALSLLAKMSASESGIRGPQKDTRARPVSLCILGGKQESAIDCHRSASLSCTVLPHEHARDTILAINRTESNNGVSSSGHNDFAESSTQSSPAHQGPFELEGSQVPAVPQFTPSTPLLSRAQQPIQEDIETTAITTSDQQAAMGLISATLPADRATNTEPSTPSSHTTFARNSLPLTATTDSTPPSSSSGVSTEAESTARRHSWENLPAKVYERLYEDALKRQRQQNQQQMPMSTFPGR